MHPGSVTIWGISAWGSLRGPVAAAASGLPAKVIRCTVGGKRGAAGSLARLAEPNGGMIGNGLTVRHEPRRMGGAIVAAFL